jgi:hypothetical protein
MAHCALSGYLDLEKANHAIVTTPTGNRDIYFALTLDTEDLYPSGNPEDQYGDGDPHRVWWHNGAEPPPTKQEKWAPKQVAWERFVQDGGRLAEMIRALIPRMESVQQRRRFVAEKDWPRHGHDYGKFGIRIVRKKSVDLWASRKGSNPCYATKS